MPTDPEVEAPLPPVHPMGQQPGTPRPCSLHQPPKPPMQKKGGLVPSKPMLYILREVKVKSSSSKTIDDTFLASNKTHNSKQAFLSQEMKSVSSSEESRAAGRFRNFHQGLETFEMSIKILEGAAALPTLVALTYKFQMFPEVQRKDKITKRKKLPVLLYKS